MSGMNTRERFQAVMNFQPFDRLPLYELAPWWGDTLDRWHGEGLPPELTDPYDICRHFGLDMYYSTGFLSTYAPGCPTAAEYGCGIIGDETDYAGIAPLLRPDRLLREDRAEKLQLWAGERQRGDAVIGVGVEGFFWRARALLGIERHLYAFVDQPDLLRRISSDLVELILKGIDQVCAVTVPDFWVFSEDMSYNHGPMISRGCFEAFMLPYYHQVVPELHQRGITVFIDSDGDITVPAHWFAEAGLDGITPLERQAGVDIVRLRAEHPRMRFLGHFDKMTMNKGEAVMRAEFERLLPTAAGGGYLISCDHQTPPGVSYRDYLLYISLFREYAELAGEMSRRKGR